MAPVWTYRWMLRLLDVPTALSGRGYPPVSGEAVLAVEDGRLAELGTHAELVAEGGAYAALWDSWHGTAAIVSR